MLSQRNSTTCRGHVNPQIAATATMGTSSLTAMLISDHSWGHWSCSQCPELARKAPHPHDSEASDTMHGDGEFRWSEPGRNATPFQSSANARHHAMSAFASWVSRVQWSNLRGFFMFPIMLLVDKWPRRTTEAARFRILTKDCKCLLWDSWPLTSGVQSSWNEYQGFFRNKFQGGQTSVFRIRGGGRWVGVVWS